MRLNWLIPPGNYMNGGEVLNACHKFYEQYKMVPDTIRLTYQDYHNMLQYMPSNIHSQEVGKEYKQILPIPGGFVEICLLQEGEEILAGSGIVANSLSHQQANPTIMVVECNKVDREFEKHVLKT